MDQRLPLSPDIDELTMPVAGTSLSSLRPLIQSTHGLVVASHPSAAMIGVDILKQVRSPLPPVKVATLCLGCGGQQMTLGVPKSPSWLAPRLEALLPAGPLKVLR